MEFQFGIEKEAEIYCKSSIISMKQQQIAIEPKIEAMCHDMISMELESCDYEKVVELICFWTKKYVVNSGWDIDDEGGVSWFLGLLCTAYVRSLRNSICPFEKIFKSCFINYFKDI
ncbi:MAG: hypothetical protein ACI30Q_07870 [Muribaculaceae bacterium]